MTGFPFPSCGGELYTCLIVALETGKESPSSRSGACLSHKGIVDSTGVLELVAFLEERFGITVQDQELVAANLDSVNGLVRFLERKLQAAEQRSDGGR